MDIIKKEKKAYLLRFSSGEEVIEGLKTFIVKEPISAAGFTAIGACREVELAFYDLQGKKYENKVFSGDREIVGIIGNIAWLGEQPIIHAHGSFADKDYHVIGGHVSKLIVSATCEVHLHTFDGKTERAFDEVTGLNLFKS